MTPSPAHGRAPFLLKGRAQSHNYLESTWTQLIYFEYLQILPILCNIAQHYANLGDKKPTNTLVHIRTHTDTHIFRIAASTLSVYQKLNCKY